MELTRSQPQYGYVVAGLKGFQLSNLAEHHYLVTFIAWQLTEAIIRAGGKIDQMRVLELCMIHDLGELFGGDIGMPYARRNPRAKSLSRKFEQANANFLSQYFLGSEAKFKKLWLQAVEPTNDEGYVAKAADLFETFCFKHYYNDLTEIDQTIAQERLPKIPKKIKDKVTKKVISDFIQEFLTNFRKGTAKSIISGISE